VEDSPEREARETNSEHAQVTELHHAFASGMIGERDYDRALAGIYSNRDRSAKAEA
jgi:hypothetical protein